MFERMLEAIGGPPKIEITIEPEKTCAIVALRVRVSCTYTPGASGEAESSWPKHAPAEEVETRIALALSMAYARMLDARRQYYEREEQEDNPFVEERKRFPYIGELGAAGDLSIETLTGDDKNAAIAS